MQVMCINNGGAPELEIGNIYTATQCDEWVDGYDIAEMPIDPADGEPTCYFKWRFIPWESIDELAVRQEESLHRSLKTKP